MALGGGQDEELGSFSGPWFPLNDHLLVLQ